MNHLLSVAFHVPVSNRDKKKKTTCERCVKCYIFTVASSWGSSPAELHAGFWDETAGNKTQLCSCMRIIVWLLWPSNNTWSCNSSCCGQPCNNYIELHCTTLFLRDATLPEIPKIFLLPKSIPIRLPMSSSQTSGFYQVASVYFWKRVTGISSLCC